jgi:hypothetical protein
LDHLLFLENLFIIFLNYKRKKIRLWFCDKFKGKRICLWHIEARGSIVFNTVSNWLDWSGLVSFATFSK